MPPAELYYFPGGGNSVTFITPGGIEGIAGRLAYSEPSGMFSLVWDEACTVDLPAKLASAVANTSNVTWPHTWVVPKYATMAEYKQYAPANHFHMIWDLSPARLGALDGPDQRAVGDAVAGAGPPSWRAWTGRCRCCTCSTAARRRPRCAWQGGNTAPPAAAGGWRDEKQGNPPGQRLPGGLPALSGRGVYCLMRSAYA